MSKYSFIAICFLLIFGCKDNTVENKSTLSTDPFSSLSKDSVVVPTTSFKSTVVLSFYEEIKTTGRPFELVLQTTQVYPGGRIIAGNIIKTGKHIEINLDSVYAPGGGPGISIQASLYFSMGNLSNDLYDISINVNGKKVEALLLVSDTSYIVKIQSNNFISSTRPRLLRIPKNIIWGQAESIHPTVYQQFLDSLLLVGAKPVALPIGEYFEFKIVTADSFIFPSMMGMRYGKYFIYDFASDPSVSRNLVISFAKKYGDSIYVQLCGGRGEMYYSTVLKYNP